LDDVASRKIDISHGEGHKDNLKGARCRIEHSQRQKSVARLGDQKQNPLSLKNKKVMVAKMPLQLNPQQ
jgi:hypothetical protein